MIRYFRVPDIAFLNNFVLLSLVFFSIFQSLLVISTSIYLSYETNLVNFCIEEICVLVVSRFYLMQFLKTIGNGNIDLILNKDYAILRYQTGIVEVKCRGNFNVIRTFLLGISYIII